MNRIAINTIKAATVDQLLVSENAVFGGTVPGDGLAAAATFEMLAEQMTSAPPPLAEPLHWLIFTP